MTTIDLIKAVLHLKKTEYVKINQLTNVIITKGVYFNVLAYATPTVTAVAFKAQYKLSLDATDLVDKGGSIDDRNLQSGKLYKMIKKLLNYVNNEYEDDSENLMLSGFDLNRAPEKHPVNKAPVIKKIVAWNGLHTVKVYIEPLEGLEIHLQESKTYKVYVFATIDTQVFTIGYVGPDSRAMIVSNVPFGTAQFYAVTVTNAAGESMMSPRMKFTLTD